MTGRVFIGHAEEDAAAARSLCEALESRGIDCWLAARDADPAGDRTFETVDALDASELVVFVITGHSAGSDLLRNEDERAASQGKRSLCVQLDDADIPDGLASIEDATDVASDALEDGGDEIAEFVRGYLEQGDEEDEPAVAADAAELAPEAPPLEASSQTKAVLALATILALVLGVAAAGAAVLIPPSHSHPRTIHGHFTLYDAYGGNIEEATAGCAGVRGYSDIHEGTFVTVTNDSGATIATTMLGTGTGTRSECRFEFTLEDLIEPPPYAIEVSDRGALEYTQSELDDLDWDVGITLGEH